MELTKEELINVNGGALKAGSVAAINGTGIIFIIGLVSGLTRPYTCSSSK